MGEGLRTFGVWNGAALAFVLVAASSGCEMSRPDGAFDGGVPWLGQQRTTADDIAGEDVDPMNGFFDDPGLVTGGTSTLTDAGGSVTGDGGGTGGAAQSPLMKHTGDYYFKVVTVGRSDGGTSLGTVTSTSTSYGQMRVVIGPDGALVAEEKLCFLDTEQTSSKGADVSTTTAAGVAQEFLPVLRTFSIDGAKWRTDVVRRRQGWRSDLDPDVMPKNPSESSKFTDPDGDSVVGYRTTVSGSASVGGIISGGRTCAYDVVSYSDTAYVEGSFGPDGSAFASASIRVEGSDLHALYAQRLSGTGSCSTSDLNAASNSTIQSDRVSLVRVPTLQDHRACASKSAYISAL